MYEIHIKTLINYIYINCIYLFAHKWVVNIRQHVKKSFTNTFSESMLKQCVVLILQFEKYL